MECGSLGSWCKASHRTCRERIGPAGRWWWWYIWFISSWLYHYHQRHRLNHHHTNSDIHWLFISIHLCNSLLGIVIAIILRWHLRESKAIEISRSQFDYLDDDENEKDEDDDDYHGCPSQATLNKRKLLQTSFTHTSLRNIRASKRNSFVHYSGQRRKIWPTFQLSVAVTEGRELIPKRHTWIKLIDGQSQRHHNDVFVPVQIQRHQPWGSIRLSSPSCHSHTPGW